MVDCTNLITARISVSIIWFGHRSREKKFSPINTSKQNWKEYSS